MELSLPFVSSSFVAAASTTARPTSPTATWSWPCHPSMERSVLCTVFFIYRRWWATPGISLTLLYSCLFHFVCPTVIIVPSLPWSLIICTSGHETHSWWLPCPTWWVWILSSLLLCCSHDSCERSNGSCLFTSQFLTATKPQSLQRVSGLDWPLGCPHRVN